MLRSLLSFAITAIAIVGFFYLEAPERRLAALLKIERLPTSIRDVTCRSRGIEDDFTQCWGITDPSDLAELMSGWPFERAVWTREVPPRDRRAAAAAASGEHPQCEGLPVRILAPTHCFVFYSGEFGHGGLGYMSFGYNEASGQFYSATSRS
jgi:hypothetical protein